MKLKRINFYKNKNILIIYNMVDSQEKKTSKIIVLAWNFYNDIRNNNSNLSKNFINIKDLEKKI